MADPKPHHPQSAADVSDAVHDAVSDEPATAAHDADSGAGAGAGIPDAELAERAGERVTRGDVRQDREKLFPDAHASPPPHGADAGDDPIQER